MILPIYTYGHPVLRQRAPEVEGDSPELQQLLDDMLETMRGANGVGLAAPQVGQPLRVFVADLRPMAEEVAGEHDGSVPAYAQAPLVFINPEVVLDPARSVVLEEGCLSIPDLREDVVRPDRLRVRYLDRSFQPQEVEAHGLLARVVQHELDHLDGVLFVDRVSALRKRLLQRRLRAFARGEVEADYPIVPPQPGGR